MKWSRLLLFSALLAGCATFGRSPVEITPEQMLALSQGPDGSFAVWEADKDVWLGFYEPFALKATPICSLKQAQRRGKCPGWNKSSYVQFQQSDVGSSWWVSQGGAPMVAWVSDDAPHPNVKVVDFATGATTMLPFVHNVWSHGERLHVANGRRSWVLAQGEKDILVHALLVPCAKEENCFQIAPPREAGFDVPVGGAWVDAAHEYELGNNTRVEAVASGEEFELIVQGLGSMPVDAGSTCRTHEGVGVITCGTRGKTTIALLQPGMPSTKLDARGAVVKADGKYWFANAESVSALNQNGELLAVGEPIDFHTGVVQLSGECDQLIYEAARDTAGQCLERTPLNAVYAGVDLTPDGNVTVDASHIDAVHESCIRDVLQRELAMSGCSGSVAFRYLGPGYATSL